MSSASQIHSSKNARPQCGEQFIQNLLRSKQKKRTMIDALLQLLSTRGVEILAQQVALLAEMELVYLFYCCLIIAHGIR